MEPILYIDCRFNNSTVPISEKMRLALLSVGELRALATRKTGLPIGKILGTVPSTIHLIVRTAYQL